MKMVNVVGVAVKVAVAESIDKAAASTPTTSRQVAVLVMVAPATVEEVEAVAGIGALLTSWMHPPAISSVALTGSDGHDVVP